MHKFFHAPSDEIPDAKAAVNKEWKKLEKISAWQMDNVRSKRNGILEAQKEKKKVHSATLMDIGRVVP